METAVTIERAIEKYNSEKIILNFLVCANHFHEIACRNLIVALVLSCVVFLIS